MKVTFVVSSDSMGGAEKHALFLASSLKDVSLNVICGKGILSECFKKTGVSVKDIFLKDNLDLFNLARLMSYLKRHRPDILHLHMNRATFLGAIAGKLLGIPSLGTVQSFTKKLYVRFPDLLTVCSPGMLNFYEQLGIPAIRMNLIYNPVPAGFGTDVSAVDFRSYLNLSFTPVTALFCGRLHHAKGVSHIAQFARKALTDFPELIFVLVGTGPEEKMLKSLKTSWNLSNLFLTGFQENPDCFMAGADFLILPSENEGLPLSLTEGLALGKPFVATSAGDTALLASCGAGVITGMDMDAMYHEIIRIAGDKQLRNRMGAAGLIFVQNRFSPETCLRETKMLYHKLLMK